jgi:NADH-quinone oxidoreductase subunit M
MINHYLLSLLIWLPFLGSVLALSCRGAHYPQRPRWIALITTLICIALCIPLCLGFDSTSWEMQFQEFESWIPALNVNYALGVDGISLPLILLTEFTTLLVILAAWRSIHLNVAQYMAAFLAMQGMMVGTFAATDALLFYVFWEAMLIPMYLSIGIWGSMNRSYASVKFFLYTFLGSALMLVALLYLGERAHSFALKDFYTLPLTAQEQFWIFLAFLLAFAVKIPMWPVHTWLPDAHTEAPAGGSVVLAALMLKLGGYGFLRFSLPILPDASAALSHWMLLLALVAIIYIGFVALSQTDMKRLIAYSSIAHMGFVVLGCFIIYQLKFSDLDAAYLSLSGSLVQMITHAFSSGALFLAVGMLAHRFHSRLIKDYGGLAQTMPVLASFFMLFALSNLGLPGTSGFVGEFMIIVGSMQANFWVSMAAAMTLILSAVYTLVMYHRVFYGEITNPVIATSADIHGNEKLVLTLLAIAVLSIGLYPNPLLNMMHASIHHVLDLGLRSKLLL